MKKALIIGITGQDGSYLADLLLSKGYEVHGLVPSRSTRNYTNIEHILDKLKLVNGDLTDSPSLNRAVEEFQYDEIYNLGAISFVGVSWEMPEAVTNINSLGHLRVLEAVRKYKPDCKVYFAASSEMYGKVRQVPQTEETPFHPRSPYGVSKCYGFEITRNYRESYNMHCCSGILFNHESPRRGEMFVTQKIAKAAARIKLGLQTDLGLGNLDAKRDIGHSKEYVRAMWLMLQSDNADDYVIATGETHSVEEMVQVCFDYVGLDWKDYVYIDPAFIRPAEVDLLIGDPSKANKELNWKHEIGFKELLEEMVQYQLDKELSKNLNVKEAKSLIQFEIQSQLAKV